MYKIELDNKNITTKEIKKICKNCGNVKEYQDKPLCYSCWNAKQRRCVKCGTIITGERAYYRFCQRCYSNQVYK